MIVRFRWPTLLAWLILLAVAGGFELRPA